MGFEKKFNLALALSVLMWAIFFIVLNGYQKQALLSNSVVVTLDIVIVCLCLKLYLKETENKKLLVFLLVAYVAVLIGNVSYGIIFSFLKLNNPQLLSYVSMLYIFPYLFFLLCQCFFWFFVIKKYILQSKIKLLSLIPFVFANGVVITIFIVASLTLVKNFNPLIRIEMLIGIVDLLVSDMVILVLICSRNKGVYLIALAVAMIVATNFWWMYLFHNKRLDVTDYSASFWLLALILQAFGLFYLLKKGGAKLHSYFGSLQGIKSQVTLWAFSLAIFSVLALCLLGYSFNLITAFSINSLPFLIIIYSIAVILVSNFVGNMFESPFRKIQGNIEILVNKTKSDIKSEFYTEEFSFLQSFILKIVAAYEEKNQEKKEMVELALQVAHDIRSPASAIMVLSSECVMLPEHQRIALRNAANRIEGIAGYLLNKYQNGNAAINNVSGPLLIMAAVLSVLLEKQLQYKNSNVKFEYEVSNDISFSFINVDHTEFKRVISNLIDNSVEAVNKQGNVIIKLIKNANELVIKIKDTGKGMSSEFIDKILNGERVSSNKDTGHGLGLSHAMSFLKKHNAKIDILSELGKGAEIILTFELVPLPVWIIDKIFFANDAYVVILDDDSAIHVAWDEKFSAYLASNPKLKIFHFISINECVAFIKELPNSQNTLFVTDYEFIGQAENGLDVVEKTKIKNSVLVTSHYENKDIIKRAMLLGIKILPKVLLSSVSLMLNENSKLGDRGDEQLNLLVLDDNKELSNILSYLYELRGKKLLIFNSLYELLKEIEGYDFNIKICIDYDLSGPVNGVEVAQLLNKMGYTQLYLATGFNNVNKSLPHYLNLLKEKMDLLNL